MSFQKDAVLVCFGHLHKVPNLENYPHAHGNSKLDSRWARKQGGLELTQVRYSMIFH